MRAVWLIMLLVGCVAQPGPLDDRGELPVDIEAPAPTDAYGDPDLFDPAGMPRIEGIVRGSDGPVAGASVWLETVDIRLAVDNLDAYLDGRAESLTTTDAAGRFEVVATGGFFHLTIDADGYQWYRAPAREAVADQNLEIELTPKRLEVVAHRGASFYAPENTVESLQKAAWLGATVVESDIRLTSDDRLVVVHDPELDRTTDGTGRVRDQTLAQLQALDAGAWLDGSFRGARIPTLTQFLDEADRLGLRLLLDVKAPNELKPRTWDRVLDVVAQRGAEDRVTFAVFVEEGVRTCAARPAMTCGWLRGDPDGRLRFPAEAAAAGADWIQVHDSLIDADFMRNARDAGVLVQAWTMNQPHEWRRVIALGVDAASTDRMGYLIDDLNGVELPLQ